jgi:hypothetical protein
MNKAFCALLFLIVACVPVAEVVPSPEPVTTVVVEEVPVTPVPEEVLEPVAVPVEPLPKTRVIVEQTEESNDCLKLGCPFASAVVADVVSDLFYDCSCPRARWVKPEDALCFESAEYAIERGYREAESC